MLNSKNKYQSIREYAILFVTMAVFFLIYHFDVIKSGFDMLPGDGGDSLLNILAADSWQDIFRGETTLRQNRIFYPFPYGRGFTDLSLSLYLMQLPWKFFCGMDMFQSVQVVYLSLLFFGVFSLFYLLRHVLHFYFLPALACAILTFFSNSFHVKLLHTQFFFLCLLPLLVIFVIRYCQRWNTERTISRILYGCGAIITYAWIAYSNFYTAFFFGLSCCIYFLIYGIILLRKGKIRKLIIRARMWEVLCLMIFGMIVFAPFLYIYMPLVHDYGRAWKDVYTTLPVFADLFNVSPRNLISGKIYREAFPSDHSNYYEFYYGLPILTVAITLFFFYKFFQDRKTFKSFYASMILTILVLYVISLKFGTDKSLWYFIWKYFPGGGSIRAVARIYVFMLFPLMTFIWLVINRYAKNFTSWKRTAFCGIFFLLMAVDHYNVMQLFDWKRSESVASIKQIAPPPTDMKCFYLAYSADSYLSQYGLKAWYMARYFKTFTVNGYSGHIPVDCVVAVPGTAEYQRYINDWIRKYKLQNVYSYDPRTNEWKKIVGP